MYGRIYVKEIKVFVWKCPVCGKEIEFFTVKQLYVNARNHLRKHNVEVSFEDLVKSISQ